MITVQPSGGNDAPAINAAFATDLSVVLEAKTYLIGSLVTIPTNGRLSGQGEATRLHKTANGNMMKLGQSVWLSGVALKGYEPFTGGAIIIDDSASYQIIENVSAWAKDCCLEITQNDGGGNMYCRGFSFICWPNINQYAVKLPALDSTGGGNRTFRDGKFSGGWGIDFNGGNNTICDNINTSGIRTTVNTRSLRMIGGRIGGTPNIDLRGTSMIWMNNLPAATVVLHPDLTDSDIYEARPIVNNGGVGVRVHP